MTARMIVMGLLAIQLSACSLWTKEPDPVSTPSEVDKEIIGKFQEGMEALEVEDYEEAIAIFDKLLVQHPTSEFDLVTMYNSAAAYEGLKDCKTAGRRYRQVVQAAAKEYPRLEAQALFRLSYAYECVGADAKALVSLIDTMKRRQFLPEEVGLAEVPARLAVGYARQGNLQQAEKFYQEALRGLQALQAKHQDSNRQRELLAKTLYFMGRLGPREDTLKIPSASYMSSMRLLQSYLLKAVEMNSEDWSPKAADQLRQVYKGVWKLVSRVEVPKSDDPQLSQRARDLKQAALIQTALKNLEELKAQKFPDPREPRLVTRLFNDLGEQERKLKSYLAAKAPGAELTPQAQKRQALKREGRTKGDGTVLESHAKQRSQLPAKKEDPNL